MSADAFSEALRRSAEAAKQGMEATIPLVARKGRASYLGERSAGHQDPGATSSYMILKAAADTWAKCNLSDQDCVVQSGIRRHVKTPGSSTKPTVYYRRYKMAKYAAAIDQGTTSTRFMIFDHAGKVVGSIRKNTSRFTRSRAGLSTTRMEIWERDRRQLSHGALAKSQRQIPKTSPRSVLPTSARPPWCGRRRPASRFTMPSSGRIPAPMRICNELAKDGGQDRFRAKVGLPLATYFSGPKMKWILDNVPGARARRPKRAKSCLAISTPG